MAGYHLSRTWYSTDYDHAEPEYQGTRTPENSIPARALAGGRQIVAVNWTDHGEVEVTYLVPDL